MFASFAREQGSAVHEPGGYVMPTVIMLMAVMSIVAYAALLQSNNSLNLAYKQAYIQMARVASKAAVDYAQEQFDGSTCGDYNGSSEQDLISNARYRVTFKAEVISTSADGYEKVVKGTGSVYLPKLATTAQYVFDVRSEIVRTFALCKSPDNFAPTVWLDASDTSTLKKTATPSTSDSSTVGLGFLDLLFPNDTVEEKVTDGTQGIFSWLSGDIEMHTCDTLEYTSFNCNGSLANRDLYNGIVFQNIDAPAGATITSATLQLSGAVPSGSGPPITQRVYGLYDTATNPHLPLFQPLGTNQVRSRMINPALRTSAYHDQTVNNFPPGNTVSYNVTNIVQELVNRPNWNPASNGGRLGLGITRLSGSGSKKACKGNPNIFGYSCEGDGPALSVSYTAGATISQANNGEGVNEWQDKSGNGNHARNAYGALPTRVDNQINGKTVVRFNNGNMLSALTAALTNKREMTVFAIVKPDFSGSAADARMISGMSSTGTNDTSGSNAIIPLLRYGSATGGFSNLYSGSSSSYRTDYSCGAGCEDTPYLFVGKFEIDGASNTITSTLKGGGAPVASKTGISPAGSPYTFSINQLYYGGRRNGAMAGGVGADYLNGDFAEIVVYDKALECRQVEALEEYFRSKWSLAATQWSTACPADVIPTL